MSDAATRAEVIERLKQRSMIVNVEMDAVNDQLSALQDALQGLCVSASTATSPWLMWGTLKAGRWELLVKRRAGADPRPVSNASRSVRIAAYHQMDELVEVLEMAVLTLEGQLDAEATE